MEWRGFEKNDLKFRLGVNQIQFEQGTRSNEIDKNNTSFDVIKEKKNSYVMNLECTLNARGQFEVECREGEKHIFY